VSDEDPFERLDEDVAEREGDPFERLGAPSEGDEPPGEEVQPPGEKPGGAVDGGGADGDATSDSDDSRSKWGEPLEPDRTDDADAVGGDRGAGAPGSDSEDVEAVDTEPEADHPLGDPTVEPAVDDARGREGDPFEAMGEAFTEMQVEGVDPDDVWQRLTSAESRGSVQREADRVYAEVSKHSYCEQCEFFSEPPDVDCSHEGTEIVEFLDMETVRVVDCPVVTERKELEGE